MIYTVTLNPAIDVSLRIKKSLKPGSVNKSSSMRTDPGGKGVNVSKVLKVMGKKSVVCMALCGPDGKALLDMLRAKGFEVLAVKYPMGNTRTNIKITGDDGITTDINGNGPLYDKETIESLKFAVRDRLKAGDVVVISGSAPLGSPYGIYADFIKCFHEVEGVKVIVDASGRYLKEALKVKPCAIKPTCDELGIEKDPEIAMEEARNIISQGVGHCLISMGSAGAAYADGEVDAIYSEAIKVKVNCTTGCGDAMTAGLACAIEEGMSPAETFKLCMALAAAEAETEGTDTPTKRRVKELYKSF